MAKVFTLIDDANRDAVDNVSEVTVKVTRNGETVTYKADLGDASFANLVTKPMGKFRAVATELGTGQDSPEAQQDRTIRAWAKDHNYDVKDRGRISASIRSAYFQAEENKDEEDLSSADA